MARDARSKEENTLFAMAEAETLESCVVEKLLEM